MSLKQTKPNDATLEAENARLRQYILELEQVVERITNNHQRIEQQLSESEIRYRTLVEMSPDAIILTDMDTRILFCNEQVAHLFGYESTRELYRKRLFELIAPEDYQQAWNDLQHILTDKALRNFEHTCTRCDGSRLMVEINASIIAGADGWPAMLLGIVRDITIRKQAEMALRASETRFRTLVEAAPVGIFILQALQISYMNAAAEAMTGYRLYELPMLDPWQLLSPEAYDLLYQREVARQRGEYLSPHFEVKIVTREGIERWLDITSVEIDFEGHPSLLAIAVDTTESRYSEVAREDAYKRLREVNYRLQRSRDLLRTIFDSIRDGLVLFDSSGTILAANQGIATLLNRSPDDLIARSWQELCLSPGTNGGEATMRFPGLWALQTLRDGCPQQRREHFSLGDGITRTLDMQVLPIFASASAAHHAPLVEQAVLHVVDVTEPLKIEALMMENERLTTGRRLTEIVAHEVNTPLQTILLGLELIPEIGIEECHLFLPQVQKEIRRIGSILHQLKNTYDSTSDAHDLININHLLEQVLELTGGQLLKYQIRIEQHLAPDLPCISGSGDQLRQVFLNLIFNAIDAMPNGGCLRLSTGVSQNNADESLDTCSPVPNHASRSVYVGITDTGTAIDPAIQRHIFEPFFMTDRQSSVLGLFLVRTVVAQHGGTITIESQAGTGTTFTLSFPLDSN